MNESKLRELLQRRDDALRWVSTTESPWAVPILDVRAITQHTLSGTTEAQYARNAVSMMTEDGRVFAEIVPTDARTARVDLKYITDGPLTDGVLFAPQRMEHKWGIYLNNNRIAFVRSWRREVRVVANVHTEENVLHVSELRGRFEDGDSEEVTCCIVDFLLRSHALGIVHPAPLPELRSVSDNELATYCMAAFGSLALFAAVDKITWCPPSKALRTDSLLHIAVARGHLQEIENQLRLGISPNLLARDGLSPLHWALAASDTSVAELLLRNGADVDVRSDEGATPLMNAVQNDNGLAWVRLFLENGADPNARDHRGFTSLHRAAEMARYDCVLALLENGADSTSRAVGYSAADLAALRGHAELAELLST